MIDRSIVDNMYDCYPHTPPYPKKTNHSNKYQENVFVMQYLNKDKKSSIRT